jgi:hypothetical protein
MREVDRDRRLGSANDYMKTTAATGWQRNKLRKKSCVRKSETEFSSHLLAQLEADARAYTLHGLSFNRAIDFEVRYFEVLPSTVASVLKGCRTQILLLSLLLSLFIHAEVAVLAIYLFIVFASQLLLLSPEAYL